MSKQLRYNGGNGVLRVNGRAVKNGDVLTDWREVRDLEELADFEVIEAEAEPGEITLEDDGD